MPASTSSSGSGSRPGLTLPVIVAAAIELADEGGLDAVTMRGVGQRLGVSGMAPYKHLTSREMLVELMVDAVVAEFASPHPRPIGWRAGLEAVAWQEWRSYLSHPWMLTATATSRPPMGPNSLAAMEWALASFDNLGLTAREQVFLLGAVISYCQGLAMTWTQSARRRDDRAEVTAWWAEQLTSLPAEVEYPRLTALAEALGDQEPVRLHEEFKFGLTRVLDGIESYLATRSADKTR